MRCFRDYIKIRGCSGDEPESGIYINSLPQISLEYLDNLADAEQKTYLGAWSDIQDRAEKAFEIDVITELAKRYRLKTLGQSIDLLKVIDKTTNQTAAQNAYYGIPLRMNFPSNVNLVGSVFHCYQFQELNFYSKAAVENVPFKIFDLQTGEELFSTTKTLVIGWNRIPVNRKFFAYRLFACVDATSITELVYQDVSQRANSAFACACNFYGSTCKTDIRGGYTSSVTSDVSDEEVTFTGNTYGLSAIFSVQCSFHKLVCNNKDLFTLPYYYLLGKECLVESLGSPRKNLFTLKNRDQVKEDRNELSSQYKKALTTAVNGITLDLGDCCIECNDPVRLIDSLP